MAEDETTAAEQSEEAPEAAAANTTGASEIQQVTASQTLTGDPRVAQDAAEQNVGGKYDDLDLTELKQELSERGLPKTGNKPDLIARLKADDVKGQPNQSQTVTPGEQTKIAATTGGQPVAGADPGGTENGAPEITPMEGGVRDKSVDKVVSAVNAVENGGLNRTEAGAEHSDLLQQMSSDRRKAQLAATKNR